MPQITLTVSGAIAAFTAGTLAAGTRIADSAGAVAAALDALRPLALSGKIAGIDLRDGDVPAIAITAAEATTEAAVLALVADRHVLVQRIAAADAASATLSPGFTAFAISDSAAAIAANLAAIQALWRAGTLATLALTDTGAPSLALTAVQVAANIDALQRIATPFAIALADTGTPTLVLPVREADITGFIAVVARITTPFTLSSAGAISAATVAGIIAGGGASLTALPANLAIIDSAGQIATHLTALQTAATAGRIASITLRDGGLNILALTTAQRTTGAQAVEMSPGPARRQELPDLVRESDQCGLVPLLKHQIGERGRDLGGDDVLGGPRITAIIHRGAHIHQQVHDHVRLLLISAEE